MKQSCTVVSRPCPVVSTFVPLLLILSLGDVSSRAQSDDAATRPVPDGVKAAYRTLSEAIQSEDMPTFMGLYDINFIYVALDRSSLDRGPWRRLWLESFELWDHEKACIEPVGRMKEVEGQWICRARRVMVYGRRETGEWKVQETLLEDTWTQREGEWKLLDEKELQLVTDGELLTADDVLPSSPRLDALLADLKAGREGALEAFWKELEGKGPIIEDIPGDEAHRLVTFIWRELGGESSVDLSRVVPSGDGPRPLEQLGDTGIWFRSERIPADARFTYEFLVMKAIPLSMADDTDQSAELLRVFSTRRDPFNRSQVDDRSAVEMPEAGLLRWLEPVEERPTGEIERQLLTSEILDERRVLYVYTPPGYEEMESPCKALFLLNDGNFSSRKVTQTILDNLIAEEKIPPVVVFLIQSEGSRSKKFELSRNLVRFVTEECVPWARETYTIGKEPRDALIGGREIGGAIAAFCGLEYPSLFGYVVVQSGAFWMQPVLPAGSARMPREYGWLAERFAAAPKSPVWMYLEVGNLEAGRVMASTQHLWDVLRAREYDVTYVEYPGNSNSMTWQECIVRGLLKLAASRE